MVAVIYQVQLSQVIARLLLNGFYNFLSSFKDVMQKQCWTEYKHTTYSPKELVVRRTTVWFLIFSVLSSCRIVCSVMLVGGWEGATV